jgi:phage baseplate assembly protein W
MGAEFLGRGWSFPPTLTTDGQVATSAYEDSVAEAIWLILGTARGERAMRPDFGCGIHDLVFAVNDATTAGLAAEEARQSLILWEPRIDLLNVSVEPSPGPQLLIISIDYRVRATNNAFNLVYPFYLNRSTA